MAFIKLNKIMLVDDSESDNYVHKLRIEKADITNEIVIKYDGQSALDYLIENSTQPNWIKPELIFLDINMPGMNGWEFLDAYSQLDENVKAEIIVTMLTTSSSEEDRNMAKKYNLIRKFETKPLTNEALTQILQEFFPNRFI